MSRPFVLSLIVGKHREYSVEVEEFAFSASYITEIQDFPGEEAIVFTYQTVEEHHHETAHEAAQDAEQGIDLEVQRLWS